ncbi:hypothetical protein OY671_007485, partial [Metschnikowia pulcherrima]
MPSPSTPPPSDTRSRASRAAATAVDGSGASGGADAGPVADPAEHARRVVERSEAAEDRVHGGFGGAPKFPVAPTLELSLDVAASSVVDPEVARRALVSAGRTVDAMAASPSRDVDGGFFRYATRPDWSEPHYERMLYDNAQSLSAATTLAVSRRTGPVDGPSRTPAEAPGTPDAGEDTAEVAGDVGRFLSRVSRSADGAFASAQDSESVVDGERVEGGYYSLPPGERAHHEPPPSDTKVLTGWNGLAIEALARAGHHSASPDLTDAARAAADRSLATHVRADGSLVRASEGGVASDAVATSEDHGALATALLVLGGSTGEARYVREGSRLVDATVGPGGDLTPPQGTDPVLTDLGSAAGAAADPSEGAVPSGTTAAARAARLAHLA